MPDVLAQDDVLSFNPSNPFLTAPDAGGSPPVAASRAAADLQPRIDDAARRSQAAIDAAERSMDQEDRNAAAREKELAPIRERQMEAARQPIPQPPKSRESPPAPQRNNQHDDESWLMAAGLLGALAGAFTRNHATNALAAFSGALSGYQEGSRQKFDENMQIWNAENKRAQEASQNALADYRAILENRKLTTDQMSVELQLAAAKHDDRAMATAARTKNELLIAQLHDKHEQALVQTQQSSDRLWEQKQRADARDQANRLAQLKDQAAAYVSSAEGQARIAAIKRGDMPPPSQGQRGTSFVALRDQAISDELARSGYNFGQFKIDQAVKQQRELIPGRVEAAAETSGARIAANREAQLGLILATTRSLIPRAAASAAAIPSTSFPRINELIMMGDREIGNPALVKLKMDTLSVEEGWAKAMNPTGQLTNYLTQRAHSVMGEANTPETYRAALEELDGILLNEQGAIESFKRHDKAAPIEFPPLKPSGSLGSAAGAAAGRAGGALDTAGLPKTPKYGVGSMVPKPKPGPSSPADMPMMLPEGWKLEQVQ